jgi:hypothetical protein
MIIVILCTSLICITLLRAIMTSSSPEIAAPAAGNIYPKIVPGEQVLHQQFRIQKTAQFLSANYRFFSDYLPLRQQFLGFE